jgi:hypothetical protein
MKFKKTMDSFMNRVGGQVAGRLEKVDLNSLLGSVGLELVKHRRSIALPLVAAFVGGMAIGALITPVNGKDLRTRIMTFVGGIKKSGNDGVRELTSDGKPVASPYEDAKAERDHRDLANARKGGRPMPIIEPNGNQLPSGT